MQEVENHCRTYDWPAQGWMVNVVSTNNSQTIITIQSKSQYQYVLTQSVLDFIYQFKLNLAVSWFRLLFIDLSWWRPRFDFRVVSVGFQSGTDTGFSTNAVVFPCQYYSASASYSLMHLSPVVYNLSKLYHN
jgi:hypothetical protein